MRNSKKTDLIRKYQICRENDAILKELQYDQDNMNYIVGKSPETRIAEEEKIVKCKQFPEI